MPRRRATVGHISVPADAWERVFGEPLCETCDGYGDVCVGFGLHSTMRPGIARCPDCDGKRRQ